MPERMWQQAQERNPDSSCMVPVLASDFPALRNRMKAQEEQRENQLKALKSYQEYIQKLNQKHTISTTVIIEEFHRKQLELMNRLVQLMIRLELHRSRGQSLTRDEEQFRMQLENVQKELNQPNQYKALLNEVNSLVRMQEDNPPISYPDLQEEDLKNFQQVLSTQAQGIQVLMESLKKNIEDVNIMIADYHKA